MPDAARAAWIHRVKTLAGRGDDDRALRVALLQELRRRIPFEAHAWLLTDPDTEVGSAPLADVPALEDLRRELPRLIRAKYLTKTNRWTSLRESVATLHQATAGRLDESLVWREVLSDLGVTDVASIVFRDRHGCWSFLDLWRRNEPPFSVEESSDLASIAAPVTEAIRRCQARTFEGESVSADRAGPVVLMLAPELDVKAQTPDTESFLRALVPPAGDHRPIPAGAYNVAAQLLAVEEGVDDHPPVARVHLHGGTWMTLRAARAEGDSTTSGDIAVTIEPASPNERLDLYVRSHALAPRESQLVGLLTRGADTRALADALHLSEHTVQDHLKSIFAKTGTRNRRTLLSRIAGA